MFILDKIALSNQGRTISYDYEISKSIAKFFNNKEKLFVTYDSDVTAVPQSISVIPLLANVMPIAWFVGFDVYVAELDATFYDSLQNLQVEFSKHFPAIKKDVKLHVKQLVQNTFEADNTALLFSGGLDSFESLTRNLKADPYLISVLGADIDIADTNRWSNFQRFNKEEKILNDNKLCYVTSNLRKFYTYKVDLLVEISWWGRIQHGMALIGLTAPLSYLKGIKTILIASSYTSEVSFGWGSTPETDEKVKWANMKVIHDGFSLRRPDKIQNVVNFAKKMDNYIKLRVCYSELRTGYNCSICVKCQRTMLGIILCGENPNNYGFNVPANLYDLIFKNFGPDSLMTIGAVYEWKCLQDKAKVAKNLFVVKDPISEKHKIDTFAVLPLDAIINKNAEQQLAKKIKKYKIIGKFPKLFHFYLKLRRQF